LVVGLGNPIALFSCKKKDDNNEDQLVSEQIIGVWESGMKVDYEGTSTSGGSSGVSITQFDFKTVNDLYAKVCFSPAVNCTWSCTSKTLKIVGLSDIFEEFQIVSIRADKLVFEASSTYKNLDNQTVTKRLSFTLYRAQDPV
jgi:hypothetical protein